MVCRGWHDSDKTQMGHALLRLAVYLLCIWCVFAVYLLCVCCMFVVWCHEVSCVHLRVGRLREGLFPELFLLGAPLQLAQLHQVSGGIEQIEVQIEKS